MMLIVLTTTMMAVIMLMLMVFLTVLDEHDVDVEGLDPATVATMLESNIMHRTAGDQRKYHYQYQNHYHYHYSLSLSTTCALLQLTKEDHCCNQGSCHQYTPSTDFTAITTNTNKKNTTNIFKSRTENKTYCHHFLANL